MFDINIDSHRIMFVSVDGHYIMFVSVDGYYIVFCVEKIYLVYAFLFDCLMFEYTVLV